MVDNSLFWKDCACLKTLERQINRLWSTPVECVCHEKEFVLQHLQNQLQFTLETSTSLPSIFCDIFTNLLNGEKAEPSTVNLYNFKDERMIFIDLIPKAAWCGYEVTPACVLENMLPGDRVYIHPQGLRQWETHRLSINTCWIEMNQNC